MDGSIPYAEGGASHRRQINVTGHRSQRQTVLVGELHEPLKFDGTAVAQGRLVARMKGAVARHEIDQMKARQCRKHRQRAEQGLPAWKHAFGYKVGEHEPDCPPNCKSHHHRLDPDKA